MKGNIVIIAFFAVLFFIAAGVVFAIFKLASNDSKPESTVSIEIAEDKELFKTKFDAYNKQIQDSLLHIRDENVKVNLKKLWDRKVKEDTTDLEELFAEAMEDEQNVVAETKPKVDKPKKKKTNQTQSPTPKTAEKKIRNAEPVAQTKPPEVDTTQPKKKVYESKSSLYSSFQGTALSENHPVVIKAVIHDRQKVSSSTNVKFRLTQGISIDGVSIPEGTFVFGKATLSNERVMVRFDNFNYKGRLLPFRYTVYDNDGWEGIHVPGLAINEMSRDAINQVANEGGSRLNIPVIGNVAINSVTKSNNEASAILSENYPVILKFQ